MLRVGQRVGADSTSEYALASKFSRFDLLCLVSHNQIYHPITMLVSNPLTAYNMLLKITVDIS